MIIGHKKQWQFFQKMKKTEEIPHAFLFSGEEKLGKKCLSLEISALLNCSANKEEPCNICSSCRAISKRIHPDIHIIEESKEIKIGEIRRFIENLSFKPSLGNFKVGVIDNAHLMTRESQNCLLKTLEEPTGNTVFFLITEYPDFLLKTVLSRLWKMRFFPVGNDEMKKYLEMENINGKTAENLLNLSFGRPGILFDLLEDKDKEKKDYLTDLEIEKVSSASFFSRLKYAKDISEKEDMVEILKKWIDHFRKKIFSPSVSFSDFQIAKENLKLILDAKFLIMTTNVNQKLLFENLLINIK